MCICIFYVRIQKRKGNVFSVVHIKIKNYIYNENICLIKMYKTHNAIFLNINLHNIKHLHMQTILSVYIFMQIKNILKKKYAKA